MQSLGFLTYMVTLCPNFSCSVLLIGSLWPSLTILAEFCLDTERTRFLLKQNQRHAAVCKPAQGEGFVWVPVCGVQPGSETLRTSSFQRSEGLAGSPQPQPEAMPRRASPARARLWLLVTGLVLGKQRAPSSSEGGVVLEFGGDRGLCKMGCRGAHVPDHGWQPL